MLNPTEAAAPLMQAGAEQYQQGNLAEARQAFQSALAVQPDLTSARYNLGVICRDWEENEVAEAHFRQVIAAGEILAESFNNLGILAMRREADQDAVAHFREAIRHRHDFPLAHFNLATLLLRRGEWDEGWREYEWRWQTPGFNPIRCPQPQWDGRELDGTLLLHTEQGIGDVFQFARFIPMVRRRVRRLVFLRPEPLACMFPQADWADEIRSPGTISLDSFDAVLPLLSAPHALKVRPDDLPCGERYLTPEPRTVELRSPPVPDAKLKVGITWRGSPTYVSDSFRSINIERFRPLLGIAGVAFYSLQVGDFAAELKQLGPDRQLVRDLGGQQRDFADTAAIVQQLDLVITVDTALLHLCGGLGLPVWGLISRRADWRWLDSQRETSRWYPSLRLFRQRTLNDWDELMQRVVSELRKRL